VKRLKSLQTPSNASPFALRFSAELRFKLRLERRLLPVAVSLWQTCARAKAPSCIQPPLLFTHSPAFSKHPNPPQY